MTLPDPETDLLIRTGIEETKLLRFLYLNRDRIVEPHDYGEDNGKVQLLTFQVGGSSSNPLPNWRTLNVEGISSLQILDTTFPGGRPSPSGKHKKWDKLYLRVKPAR